MSEQLKPLTLADLKVGECYAWISVHLDNSMHCVYFRLEGVVDSSLMLITEESNSDNEQISHATTMGLIERNYENMHRVFDGTPETRAALEQLVAKQDLAEYARLIGMSPADFYDLKRNHIANMHWLYASIVNFKRC